MNINRVNDDTGWFYSIINQRINFNSLISKTTTSPIDPVAGDFYTRNISFQSIVIYYDRVYIKIYQVLAQSKVMFDIVFIIFTVFGNSYAQDAMNASFLNIFYSFPSLKPLTFDKSSKNTLKKASENKKQTEVVEDDDRKDSPKIELNKKKNKFTEKNKVPTLPTNGRNQIISTDSLRMKEKFEEILRKKRKNQGKIKIPAYQHIMLLFCGCCKWVYSRDNLVYFRLLGDEMKNRYEFVNYLKVWEDLRKLKMLILSKEQYNVIEFISKPEFPPEEEGSFINYLREDVLKKNFFESVKKIQEERNDLSEKIMACLDEDLVALANLN